MMLAESVIMERYFKTCDKVLKLNLRFVSSVFLDISEIPVLRVEIVNLVHAILMEVFTINATM